MPTFVYFVILTPLIYSPTHATTLALPDARSHVAVCIRDSGVRREDTSGGSFGDNSVVSNVDYSHVPRTRLTWLLTNLAILLMLRPLQLIDRQAHGEAGPKFHWCCFTVVFILLVVLWRC